MTHTSEAPDISILIPVYNMSSFLEEAVESIMLSDGLGVDFTMECIIIDDGSDEPISPDTFASNNSDLEIRHIRIDNQGKSAALNKGLELATGKYVTIVDADDKLPSQSLAARLKAGKEGNADFILGGFTTFDHSGPINYRNPLKFESLNKGLGFFSHFKFPYHLNAVLAKRSLFNATGSFDVALLRAQDIDYFYRLLQNAKNGIVLETSVYLYRRYARERKVLLKNRIITMQCRKRIIRKHISGVRCIGYQCLNWFSDFLKFGYELVLGVYKK